MKKDIHPEYYPVVFVDSSAGFEFTTHSTKKSGEVRNIDGVDHYVLRVEISSASHPFYTGKQKFVDAAGRIEKFQKKYGGVYASTTKAPPVPVAAPAGKSAKPAAPAKK